MSHLLTPTILLLKDGSETAQGKSHVIHNINACQAIGEIVKTTLGPRGMDKLIYTQNGRVTISNDGRTIIELLDIVHPAAKTLVDIAIAQDKQVGDGTTTVVILASEFLKQAKIFIEDGVHPQTIIKAYRRACNAVLERLNTLAVDYRKKQEEEKNTPNGVEEDNDNKNDNNDSKNNDILNTIHYRNILEKCAKTALQSKLIATHRDYFSKIAVDAVLLLNPNQLDLELIGICKVPGGSVTESEFVKGVAFKKTFSYAGFEQQPKKFTNPKILVLNIELELKAEKENAEVRLKDPDEYQSIVDAEWEIIYDKLEKIYKSGANVILSRLAIGDLATQYFADRNIFCAGRVPENDLKRISIATGAIIQTTLNDLSDNVIGNADNFEEKQIGSERYNYITNCKNRYISTIILRGGAEQFIEETHRSLWDALMVIKRCIQHCEIVGGGGAIEMELSKFLREYSKQIKDKTQLVIGAYAKALEIIPRQLSHNAGLDSTDIINQLRYQHAKGHRWYGIDIENGGVFDTLEHFIWEPSINKKSAINAATEATCTILSIDETIKNAKATDANQAANRPAPPPGHGLSSKPSIR